MLFSLFVFVFLLKCSVVVVFLFFLISSVYFPWPKTVPHLTPGYIYQ